MRNVIAGPSNPIHIESIHPDVKRERLRHYPVQLSNAGTVTTIEIPGWAKILKIYPLESDVVYAFDENPSAATFNADTSLLCIQIRWWVTLRLGDSGNQGYFMKKADLSIS